MKTQRLRWAALLVAGASILVTPAVASAQKRDRDVLTHDEIMASAQKDADLWRAIRSLRPQFLDGPKGSRLMNIDRAAPGQQYATQRSEPLVPVVYINGNRSGDPDALKGILASEVEEVRYLSPSKAEMEYGVGHDGGAIQVKLAVKGPKTP